MKLESFQYATSLDLNMGYYHIQLMPNAAHLCTIILPWGKYEYVCLPMGIQNALDIFQEAMSELMHDLEFIHVYLDDLLCITTRDWSTHLKQLDQVFSHLEVAGLKVNAAKSSFGQTELEYLGFWINHERIQPLTQKVETIQNIKPPTTRKQ